MSTNRRLAPGMIVYPHKKHSAIGKGIKGFFMLRYETTPRALLGDRKAKESFKRSCGPGLIVFLLLLLLFILFCFIQTGDEWVVRERGIGIFSWDLSNYVEYG